ncbi:uncharacterized protein LOC130014819 [Mercurialis annua]|uniref:uncharacterized protein LOC130014819 n=1 Tax=Mercurialis annua TaxID=3986 RepID=UPI0024AFDEC7|nr:uncharacterized protein LOC130014819 [Mercurialis annua]
MQSMISFHGLPLSVSGITHHLTLSKEMVDHDRRREAMKRRRSHGTDQIQEMGFEINVEIDEDLALVFHHLFFSSTAKAA